MTPGIPRATCNITHTVLNSVPSLLLLSFSSSFLLASFLPSSTHSAETRSEVKQVKRHTKKVDGIEVTIGKDEYGQNESKITK